MTPTNVLLVFALAGFIAAAVGAKTRVNLVAAGLACVVGALLVGLLR